MPLGLNGTTGVQDNSGAFVAGTAVASTSGTSIDFTGIPSWVKRITVCFSGVSTNGASRYLFQLGTSSGVVTTGYTSTFVLTGISTTNGTFTTGIGGPGGGSGDTYNGLFEFTLLNSSTNLWVGSGQFGYIGAGYMNNITGSIALASAVTRLRVTTANGTDAFDAGSINILWE
jgi:hypothetical protein